MKKFWIAAALLFAAMFWVFGNVVAEEINEYVGDNEKKCKMCHKDQVKEWQTWPMSKAWDLLDDKQKKDEKCFSCHVTGYDKPGGFVSEEKTPKLAGVQCEACHGPAGDHMAVPLTDKEGKAATMSKPTEENCSQCHKKEGNPNYKEFKFKKAIKELEGHFNKK